MDAKTKRLFAILFYFGLAVGALALSFNEAPVFHRAWNVYFLFAALLIAQNILILKDRMRIWSNAVCFAVAMGLALWLQYYDRTVVTGFSVMIVTIVGMLTLRPLAIYPVAAAALAASAILYCLTHGVAAQAFWSSVGTMFLHRLILLLAVSITRYSIAVNAKNRKLAESLRQKTEELERYAEELEETADLRAKDQLMRELHDRLGHLLVTASISAQAASVLVDRDPGAAKARLVTAWEQIQSAMRSLREVLNGGGASAEREPTFAEFDRLSREAEARTGIPIRLDCPAAADFDALPLSKRSFLYNALMEGLTNGIRHGRASRFDVSLSQADGVLRFRVKDDGAGFSGIRYGYGLSKIDRDARRFGGSLSMNGENGCELTILLPPESPKTEECADE